MRSIWPIWRTPSHSSPVLLLEKHPTAKWLVEQVFYINIDCKIWTKGTHALSRLTEGDHVLMTWLTSWTRDPSKAATPLSEVGRTVERIMMWLASMNKELEVTTVFHNRGHRGGTRGVRKTVQRLGGRGHTSNYSICFGKQTKFISGEENSSSWSPSGPLCQRGLLSKLVLPFCRLSCL